MDDLYMTHFLTPKNKSPAVDALQVLYIHSMPPCMVSGLVTCMLGAVTRNTLHTQQAPPANPGVPHSIVAC